MSEDEDNLSTTAVGNAFRDRMARYLELTPGCSNVATEVWIGTQQVDIAYDETSSFQTIRVACECKNYSAPLTRNFIAEKIYGKYHSLLEKELVDAVRIIAPLDVNAIARAYIKECGFTFQTSAAVAAKVMDFRAYLQEQVAGFAADGLQDYYVPPLVDGDKDLESTLLSWVEVREMTPPVAILAGYGMGKTSIARRLASVLAARATESRGRVPIVIPLSEISAEQDLEGLLGKMLAARSPVPGYFFEKFMELNRQGHFVIILDGFDEMKHTLSWEEFAHNFEQLNRLTDGNSRVLLLGRPSALLSEDEENFVLRGRRREGAHSFVVPGSPEYRQIALQPFSAEQALHFIARYAEFRLKNEPGRRSTVLEKEELDRRIEHIRCNTEMMELVSRPVQARMLSDLALDPEVTWRSFGRSELYREFIQRLTARDVAKPSRKAFDVQTRVKFARRLAWWLWRQPNSSGFSAEALPDSQIMDLPGVKEANAGRLALKRDLVSGSLLEKKAGEKYYFPHRSFLEFLVAEYIGIEGTAENGPSRSDIGEALTAEIGDFLRESGRAGQMTAWAEGIEEEKGSLSANFFELTAWALNTVQGGVLPQEIGVQSPRHVLLDFCRRRLLKVDELQIVQDLRKAFSQSAALPTRIVCLMGIVYLAVEEQDDEDQIGKVACAFVLRESLDELSRLTEKAPRNDNVLDTRNVFVNALAKSFNAVPGKPELIVQLSALFEALNSALDLKWRMSRGPLGSNDEIIVDVLGLGAVEKELAMSKRGGVISKFFKKFPNPGLLIPVRARDVRYGDRR